MSRLLRIAEIDNPQRCHCGSPLILQYSVPQLVIFKAFVTRNITTDGSPVEVRSADHQAELCKVHGVRPSPLRDHLGKGRLTHDRKTVQGSISEVQDRLKKARKLIREVSPADVKAAPSNYPLQGSITPEMIDRREKRRVVEA